MFAKPNHPLFDSKFAIKGFHPWTAFKKGASAMFSPDDGVAPHEAIDSAMSSPSQMDCRAGITVVILDALRHSLGDAEFDRVVAKYDRLHSDETDEKRFVSLPLESFVEAPDLFSLLDSRDVSRSKLGGLASGSIVYFKNAPGYSKITSQHRELDGGWSGEWAVKMSSTDSFLGIGL